MDNGYTQNITDNNKLHVELNTVENNNEKNGQDKCPKCGATDISMNVENGKLRCNFCRYEFEPVIIESDGDLTQLKGQVITAGANDISKDAEDILTLRCESCGAEVVIDTLTSQQARCHWCRNILSLNQKVPNGAVPDVVLPFSVTKEAARAEIEKFVSKRKFFANPTFKKEFTTNNIMGVYFPYMIVDVNAHASFVGEGEKEIRRYRRGSGDNERTYYDADLYNIERDFDIVIDDLSVESSSERLNNNSQTKTNNVINAIMPFDTENCVKWNANYLRGYSSEKRDTNVEQLQRLVHSQAVDVAKFATNPTLTKYDRGVCWKKQDLQIKGQRWKAAYLPVWLYSYQEVSGQKKTLHYVAVNARTKETMGSVPINKVRLLFTSVLIELICIYISTSIYFSMDSEDGELIFLLWLCGFFFYFIMHKRYRNDDARHNHETETKSQISNLLKTDKFVETKRGLSNSRMYGANNNTVSGKSVGDTKFNFFNNFK